MWEYDFIQNALIAGMIVATISGIISVFVVLRQTAFATHALGHMSLTGAALGTFMGFSIMCGQLFLNLIAALIMGCMGDKIKKNDLVVGVILTIVLGFGAYFLSLFQNGYAGGIVNILFGDILVVSQEQINTLLLLSTLVLIILIVFMRPLIFVSIDPILAKSKNISVKILSIVFFILLAITVSMACRVVGALLIFVLLVIPGAIAMQWAADIYKTISISVFVANLSIIVALYIAFYLNLPMSFVITMFLSSIYFGGIFKNYTEKIKSDKKKHQFENHI